ncbi:hypothetical protein B5M09_011690 [Aphanomyces astaci]|uniref:Uncharacterized protein n=1 Tax=Aphanomyces astaci TaxID=112090 RepID=A0A3R8DND4_APHAT|nr:hypothetical protein B5M09_011690 [Aphanomyces astaci]
MTWHAHNRSSQARETHAFDFKPAINKKSSEIMQQGRKGDFIERVAKYALRKEHDKLKKKSIKLQVFYARNSHTVCGQDPQCTFKPKINNVSANRVARSVTELSRGDLLKRETTQRLLKLRVRKHTLKLYEKQRKALQEQEILEFTECTFKPQTIDVPSYISVTNILLFDTECWSHTWTLAHSQEHGNSQSRQSQARGAVPTPRQTRLEMTNM